MARVTVGVTFLSIGSDNELQVLAAGHFSEWRRPSDMHWYARGKTLMKDVCVLGVVVTQRLLGDRKSDYPHLMLGVLTNSVSAVLVFIIASSYWNTEVGLLTWALLVTCLWPYQLALYGAPICTGQMLFLLAIYFIDLAGPGTAFTVIPWYFAAGLATGLFLFSSASSRKFLPLVGAAFIFSQAHAIWEPSLTWQVDGFVSSGIKTAATAMAVILTVGSLALLFGYKRAITAMYTERAPGFLNRLLTAKDVFDLPHYFAKAKERVSLTVQICLVTTAYLVVSLLIVRTDMFFWSQLSILAGVVIAVVVLTYPDTLTNIRAYHGYSQMGNERFYLYREYFERIGKPISETMRGAGLLWLFRYFGRMAPVQLFLYILSAGALVPLIIIDSNVSQAAWQAGAVMAISVAPTVVAEVTGCPQCGRPYYPALIGMLLLVGYTGFLLHEELGSTGQLVLWAAVGVALVAGAARTVWLLMYDVLPARMGPAKLHQELVSLGVSEFYTYDNRYNEAFVGVLPPEFMEQIKVHHIESLQDVTEGYIVVPGTSSKAWNMESIIWRDDFRDFEADEALNYLLDSKTIERCAVASFKTFGTSRIWLNDSEVPSYRELILKEITEDDRWRGRAWILDAGKVQEELRQWRRDQPRTSASSMAVDTGRDAVRLSEPSLPLTSSSD